MSVLQGLFVKVSYRTRSHCFLSKAAAIPSSTYIHNVRVMEGCRRWKSSGKDEDLTEDGAKLKGLLERLSHSETSSLCDAHKSAFSDLPFHVMPSTGSIQPRNREAVFSRNDDGLHGKRRIMVGLAFTVQCAVPDDFLAVLEGLEQCPPGHVLMVNTCDATKAVAGGLFVTEAYRKQLAGIVVDGPIRDVRDINPPPSEKSCEVIPIFSSTITPYSGTIQVPGSIQVPITMCDDTIPVHPGDVVVADSDGIVIAPPETMHGIIETAESITITEDFLMTRMLRSNDSLVEMTNLKEHLQARKAGKQSALEFRLE